MKLIISLTLICACVAWSLPAQDFTAEDTENWKLLEEAEADYNDELDEEKRTIPDHVLEEIILKKCDFVLRLLGPFVPPNIKDVIRGIVQERKTEIAQAIKQGGQVLIKLAMNIVMAALAGGVGR